MKELETHGMVPDFQKKKIIRKKALSPLYENQSRDHLYGVAMQVNRETPDF